MIQIFLGLMLYVEPLYMIPRSKLNVSGTVKERVAVVVASNRPKNIEALKERIDFSPIIPSSLENDEMDLSGSSQDIIKKLYVEGLKKCDKVYCMILDDDVVFIYNDLKEVLFDNIISYNNDNNYVFDCSKKGFLRRLPTDVLGRLRREEVSVGSARRV
ncbi:hypothetical protein BGZ80_002348 [Entomortierella chlamydospora]|uniref:Uncharacterized protein n=1 Tax=Entomortierella chlamydospora TaxID=101097 RepID=A0A9P6SXD5_9FUNG|nr:hypothetical protein BGZ79_004809 [Entomortierella chlamydospora]KAG0009483.1 hypothetical protein BGZ80_002348 [Entomortierella chlamydospora]